MTRMITKVVYRPSILFSPGGGEARPEERPRRSVVA